MTLVRWPFFLDCEVSVIEDDYFPAVFRRTDDVHVGSTDHEVDVNDGIIECVLRILRLSAG